MDSNTTMTHVVAIGIGVLLTLGMVNVFSSSKQEPAAASTNVAPTANQKKKKKKNKKKASNKGEETASSVKEEDTPKQPVTTVDKGTASNGNSNGSSNNNNNNSGNQNQNQQAGKKNAKKAKKNANNKGSSNGASKEKKATAVETNAVPAPAPVPVPSKPPVEEPTSFSPSDRFEQAPSVEEEWNSVGGSKKKKAKKARAPASSSTPISTSTTVNAGSAAATTKSATVTGKETATEPPPAVSASDSISIDARKAGIIIGPKGATLLALQEATGCKLDVNAPSRDSGPPAANAKAGVVITGPNKESIQIAKKAIQELATKGYATLLQSDDFGEFGTQVHPRMLSEIVGPGGKTIQAIQTALDVKLTIPSTDWKPNAPKHVVFKPVRVGIAGTKENAKTAKAVIQALQKYHHHEVTHPGMIHKEIYVPQEFFHCVIGVRGSEIKHIRGNFKVDMYMPSDDSESDNVLVVGPLPNVDRAIAYIQRLMDRDSEARQQKYNDEYY